MYIPKRYGESKVESCPFCGRQAIVENPQGVPVCNVHKDKEMPELKCVCGEYLFMQKGKFGIYFNCMRCGNINMKKVLELNDITKPDTPITPINNMKREEGTRDMKENIKEKIVEKKMEKKVYIPKDIIIRSDDPNYFD